MSKYGFITGLISLFNETGIHWRDQLHSDSHAYPNLKKGAKTGIAKSRRQAKKRRRRK